MNLMALTVRLAKNGKRNDAVLTRALIKMKRKNIFLQHGYSGVFAYCQQKLEYDDMQCHYFQRVVNAALQVPTLEKAVTSGELTVSQARRIVPVITESNANEWLTRVKELPQRELEKAVAAVNPNAAKVEKIKPVAKGLQTLTVTISDELAIRLRRIQDLESQRTRKPVTLEQALEKLTEGYLEKNDPIKKAERAKPKPFPQESKRALPAAVKHAVVRRDENRCTFLMSSGKRCDSQRWLEIHHQMPLALGGLTVPENLTTLCAAHHRHQHHTV